MLQKLKTLAGDTLIYGVFTVFGRFLTFLLTPFYTNFLDINSPEKYENDFIIYIFSLIAFINIMYSLGMESAFFRFYEKDNPDKSKQVFSHSLISITVISSFFALIIIYFSTDIGLLITKLPNSKSLIILSALIPVFDALVLIPYAKLRVERKAKKFATLKFVQIVITIFMNLILVGVFKLGVIGVIISFYTASFLLLIYFLNEIKLNIVWTFDKKLFMNMFKFGLPTLPASFSAMILQVADRPILKAITHSSTELAVYGINYRLGIPMMMFVTVFEYAWKPFYLSNYTESDSKKVFARVFTYFTVIASFIFLITSFFIEYIVKMPFLGGKFIHPDFWGGLGIIPIILGGYYFNGAFTNFSACFLIEKKTYYLPIAVGSAALINVVANFILIPFWGYWGAAYATLIAYFVSAVILLFLSRNVYSVDYEWKRVGISIISTLVIFIIIKQLSVGINVFLMVSIKIIAIIAYIVLLKVAGFFNIEEINLIKKLLKLKK